VGGVFRFLEGSQVALGDHSFFANFARTLSVKFKQLIKGLKVKSKELSRLNTLIHNSSWVLAFLDGLEEAQSLTITEKNFRAIVKNYLTKLLEAKRTYWKQRATIQFVKFGDENTKVFQEMATHANRKNQISHLFLENGDCLTHHNEKAEALWTSFKGRLGISECATMSYDLNSLIPNVRLLSLDFPFTAEEIKSALTDMPSDHAPGLDGFNDIFMKKCWNTVERDLLRRFTQFCRGVGVLTWSILMVSLLPLCLRRIIPELSMITC
jgi:hypothetical protein